MFAFDIETLGTTESSIILSAAILYFDSNDPRSYQEMLDSCCFVKFSVNEQKDKYNRTVTKDTINWWHEQCDNVKKISLFPSENDLTLAEGVDILKSYIKTHTQSKEDVVWTRGSLDQFCIDSVCKYSLKIDPIFYYGQYVDFRTAIQLLKSSARKGYCDIPNLDKNMVMKHDPRHDVCYDVFMLLHGT